MRRLAVALAVAILATLVLLFLAVGYAETMLWLAHVFGVKHALGTDTQSSENYAFVSGTGPIIVTVLGFSGVGVTAYRTWRKHVECHVDSCSKIGHPVQGTSHRACKVHHPHRQEPVTPESIAHAAKHGHSEG